MSITKVRFVTHAGMGTGRATTEAANNPLNPDEIKLAERLGHYWQRAGYRPDQIHTTPLTACAQTAKIAACVFGGETPLSITEPPELYVTDMSLRKIAAALIEDAPSDSSSIEEHFLDEESRALLTGGQLVRYAISLRAQQEPPTEVVAVTDHYSINSVVSLTEVGLNALGENPRAQLYKMLANAPQEPCAESLLVAEGSPACGNFMLSVVHVGQSTSE